MSLTPRLKRKAFQLYAYLSALFLTSLVVSNLIFQKFFSWHPFGEVEVFGAPLFELSVGILPYPVTFLITDLISEIFGKKKANQVVVAGIFASFFSLLIVYTALSTRATAWSPIGDETFSEVFGNSGVAVFASMMAYLLAQFVDIQLYHFWKRITHGRMLWVRNNFSTFSSQFIDTFTVVLLLCIFNEISWDRFYGLVLAGFAFKVMVAIADTPLLYGAVYITRRTFNLKIGEEIRFEY